MKSVDLDKIVRVLLANWYVRFLQDRLNQVTEIEGLSDIRHIFNKGRIPKARLFETF